MTTDDFIASFKYSVLQHAYKKKNILITRLSSTLSQRGKEEARNSYYVGTIKGLGRIYQQTGIDAYSNFGFAKVYFDKKAPSAIDFLKIKALPVYQMFHIQLDRILTDNGKKYTTHWKSGKHDYEIFLTKCGITHTRIKPRCPKSNGMVERFNRTLLE